jgi:site-specific recombinase XerD
VSSPQAVSSADHGAIERWLSEGQFSDETRRSYEREMLRALRTIEKPIDAICTADLQAFVDALGAPSRTARRIVATLRSFFAAAQRAGAVARDPASSLRLPAVEQAAGHRELAELETMRILARVPDGRDRALVRTLYGAALTPEEAADLRWRDLQLDRGRASLRVRGRRPRIVTIKVSLYAALIRLRAGASESDPIFGISARQIRRIVRDVARRAGIGRVEARDLREAHALHALGRGASTAAVAQALGVASVGKRLERVRVPRPSSSYLRDA